MHPFILRPWQLADLPQLVKNANDPDIARWMTDTFPHPYTLAAGEAFLNRVVVKDGPASVMAIEIDGEPCGSIGIFPLQDIFRRNAELGYWLKPEYSGRGIMTAAIRRMVDHAFDHFPELDRIFARPFGSNIASQRALDKAGFLLEAKFHGTIVKNGKVEDELVYAIRR
jgi:[ribosomal protein S5]-alanine N-acetyltransferase